MDKALSINHIKVALVLKIFSYILINLLGLFIYYIIHCEVNRFSDNSSNHLLITMHIIIVVPANDKMITTCPYLWD